MECKGKRKDQQKKRLVKEGSTINENLYEAHFYPIKLSEKYNGIRHTKRGKERRRKKE